MIVIVGEGQWTKAEWHCRLSGLKLRRVAGEQFGAGLFARLHQ